MINNHLRPIAYHLRWRSAVNIVYECYGLPVGILEYFSYFQPKMLQNDQLRALVKYMQPLAIIFNSEYQKITILLRLIEMTWKYLIYAENNYLCTYYLFLLLNWHIFVSIYGSNEKLSSFFLNFIYYFRITHIYIYAHVIRYLHYFYIYIY